MLSRWEDKILLDTSIKLCYDTSMELDRITLNFGSTELELARQIRKRAGKGQLNRLIKQAIRDYLARQEHETKNS